MLKKFLPVMVIVLIIITTCMADDLPGFRVIGRHLYDVCGERVILRGVANPNIWFERNGLVRYEEIEKTGANVVRIVWSTGGTPQQLDEAIANCISFGMIPMPELHDATGVWKDLQICVDYWCRSDVVEVLQKHQEYLLVNIANECGDYGVTAKQFRTGYQAAVLQMREAGIHVPLVIDGTDWGKNINILQSEGAYLINADPDHNLIFSIHMWWPKMYGYDRDDIINELAESVRKELPLIVGEFSQMHGACEDDEITANNSIDYLTVIKQCHINEIGWIAWSWFGNCNPFWDMASNGTFESLYDWGLEVAVTDSFSILNTSVRPYFIVNMECNPSLINNNNKNANPTLFELSQNYPNPFNATTRIAWALSSPAHITMNVYDIQGRFVTQLVNEQQAAGSHTVTWNGRNDSGVILAGGVYIYRLTVHQGSQVFTRERKLVMIK